MNRRLFLAAGASALLAGCGAGQGGAVAAPAPVKIDLHRELSSKAKVLLPAGDFVVASRLPPGNIEGVGPQTRLIMAPECDILMDGAGEAVLQNLSLIGNNRGRSYATGMAVNVRDGLVYMDGVYMENFRASYWVVATNARLEAYRCTAVSQSGNAPNGAVIQEIAHVFTSYRAPGLVADSTFDIPHIKGAVAVFGAGQMTVRGCTIRDAGAAPEISNEAAAYAILAYPDGGLGPTLTAEHNTILRARSCGIYAAGAKYVEARRNHFEGINLDAAPWEIPKAAIALNQVLEFYEEKNTFADNAHDIVAAWPTGKYEIRR